MSQSEKLVVIGGNAAGLSAASYLKRRKPEIEVVVFEKSPHASYGSCGLPYYIEGLVKDPLDLIAVPIGALREKRGLDVRVLHEVVDIHTQKKQVTVKDIQGDKVFELSYDWLVVSTGASPIIPPFARVYIEGVFTLRNLEDGIKVGRFIKEESPKRVAVIGGGYIGMEVAEAFSVRGFQVTLIEKLPRVLPNFDAELSEKVQEKLEEKDIKLMLGSGVKSIEGDGVVKSVITETEIVETDLVLLGVGIKPEVVTAKNAGIELGETGAIKVNDRMETNISRAYACGDCAEAYHRILKRNVWIPLGDTANKQGRIAGANIAGEEISFPGIIGSAATKVFEMELARTGLGEEEARREGFDVATTLIESSTRAHYYPEKKPIIIKLIAEKRTGRLIGAQAVGGEGVAKRIDVLATAIWAKMSLDDVAWLDLTYVPPVAPVWDPVLVAAQVGMKSV
ncbi:MAG: FAD-dependent oxidoreductase [Candidatus Dadabacteria bacterium]|nr:FAD-dependent oxidoreductase [Candidatus Dadabacteria bacterium]